MLSSHLNCVEIRCSETRIQDPAGLPVRTEAGVEEEVEKEEGTLEGEELPPFHSPPLLCSTGYNGKMEGLVGWGRKFANFHDRAWIISGWLGGFRT